MLKGTETVDEIVEFFKNYKFDEGGGFEPKVYRSNKSSRQSSVEPSEEDISDKLSGLRGTKLNKNNGDNHRKSSNNLDSSSNLKANKSKHSNKDADHDNHAAQRIDRSRTSSETVPDLQEINRPVHSGDNDNDSVQKEIIKNNYDATQDKYVRNIDATTTSSNLNTTSTSESNKNNNKEQSQENCPPVKTRNVFDFVDADFVKRMIPFMHPSSKNHTFKYFLEKVDEVVKTIGKDKLIDEDILDLMQFRMGGTYLSEMKDLRSAHTRIEIIREYFAKKDDERDEEMLKKQEILLKTSQVNQSSLTSLIVSLGWR